MAEDLFKSIEMNDLPQVKSILHKGPQLLNTINEFGYTPLIAAVKDGRNEIIYYLLDAGADINAGKGYSALGMAIWNKNYEAVKILINHRADVNILNGNPLNLAVQKGDLDIVKLLIGNKADVNVLDHTGMSLVNIAAYHGNFEIVKALVAGKANVNQGDKNGSQHQSGPFRRGLPTLGGISSEPG